MKLCYPGTAPQPAFVSALLATTLGVSLAACTPQADAPASAAPASSTASASTEGSCFLASRVDGYTVTADNRVRVSTGPRQTYEFETLGSCPELRRNETIALDQTGSGTICQGIDVDLIVRTSIGLQRCPVKMIRRLESAAGN